MAQWITEGFRTTPVSALEMATGLFPVQHQVDKLMKKACLHTRLLHPGHLIRAQLVHLSWQKGLLNITALLPLSKRLSHDGITPMLHIDHLGRACTKEFQILAEKCCLGDRVKDVFADQVIFHIDIADGVQAPVKADHSKLAQWIQSVLGPMVDCLKRDSSCALVFTNGSQKKGEHLSGGVAAGAG